MATWMLWAATVTALFGVAAHLVDLLLRSTNRPARGVWLGALAAVGSLMVGSLLRPTPPAVAAVVPTSSAPPDPSLLDRLGAAAAAAAPITPQVLDGMLLGLWAVSATVLTGGLLTGMLALHRRARGWRVTRVAGQPVLVSEDFGPALVGVLHPRVVLPEWALDLPRDELRLACLHEVEHRAGHDTRILFGGALLTMLMPWNPAAWWVLRRLRQAVEMDCDARVLETGVSRRAYGSLLLELGTARGRPELPVLALARAESLLERRMKMIVKRNTRRGWKSSASIACAAALLVVLACETPAPTLVGREEQVQTSVVQDEQSEGLLSEVRLREMGARLVVDGVEQDELPQGLTADDIERVDISRIGEEDAPTISVSTRRVVEGPAVYIDGEQIHGANPTVELEKLDPADIARVDVTKGENGDEIRVVTRAAVVGGPSR